MRIVFNGLEFLFLLRKHGQKVFDFLGFSVFIGSGGMEQAEGAQNEERLLRKTHRDTSTRVIN